MAAINEELIHQAVADAIRSVGAYNPTIDFYDEERTDFFGTLRDKPDDFVVEGMYESDVIEWGTGNVEVDTPDELTFALNSLYSQTDFVPVSRSISTAVEHERRHVLALNKVHVRASRYGFTLIQADPELVYRPYSRGIVGSEYGVTKLAIAAVTAAPMNPSDGDMRAIYSMGYANLVDIGMRIYEANSRANSSMYPLPGSFSMSTAPDGAQVPYASADDSRG